MAKHSRNVRSAKNPRGIYAPPFPSTSDTTAATSPADLHTGPSTSLKRKRAAAVEDDEDAFAFSGKGGFKINKHDKRSIRHQQLLAKVRDSGVKKQKVLKRRRPAKKLKTDLSGLADALPEAEGTATSAEDGDEEGWEGISDEDYGMAGIEGMRKAKRRRRAVGAGTGEGGVMRMKSLRHRPGAMKRKRRMETGEMERFGRNLAQMVKVRDTATGTMAGSTSGEGGGGDAGASQSDRWAALRRFIGGTMEKSEAFGKK